MQWFGRSVGFWPGGLPDLRVEPADPDRDPSVLRYSPSDRLAELVRDRDGHCRFPGCSTAADRCDLDHVVPFDHDDPRRGGWTVPENLACLCRYHHRAKTAGVWSVSMEPGGTQQWAGPTGQRRTTSPEGLPPTPVELDTVLGDLVELWVDEVRTWAPAGTPQRPPPPADDEPPPF